MSCMGIVVMLSVAIWDWQNSVSISVASHNQTSAIALRWSKWFNVFSMMSSLTHFEMFSDTPVWGVLTLYFHHYSMGTIMFCSIIHLIFMVHWEQNRNNQEEGGFDLLYFVANQTASSLLLSPKLSWQIRQTADVVFEWVLSQLWSVKSIELTL